MLKKLTLLILLLILSIPLSFADTEITQELTGTSLEISNSYGTNSKTIGEATYNYNACNPNNGSVIQFNNSTGKTIRNCGLVLTESPGVIKEIEIKVTTCKAAMKIYGSKTAYSSVADVYSSDESARGEEIGNVTEVTTLKISDLTGGGTNTSPSLTLQQV
jgi:transposase